MGKILVIAEKPSVASDIGRVLGCKAKGNGFIENKNYIVSWALGHLITLGNPEDYDKNLKKWRVEDLPIIPEKMKLKAIKKTYPQLKVLKELMNSPNTDYIICATDSGREGELIFRYIYSYVRCKKHFKRLWISSMTDTAIKEGFDNLKDSSSYDLLYHSAKCRSEADWLVGMNASRAYTLRYNALLSVGRVQTPTLGMIVDRHREIENFVPSDYYEVWANFDSFKAIRYNKSISDTRIDKLNEAKNIAEKINGKYAELKDLKKEVKKTVPPLLYDLTELQRQCNSKYGFSAKKTLDIAQSLYEKRKMLTYPRTDSRYLSDDMPPKVISTMKKIADNDKYGKYAARALDGIKFTKRIIDNSKVSDHHAIIPTDRKINTSLTEDENKVFDLVVRRFIAVFFPSFEYENTQALFECEGEKLVSKSNRTVKKGWRVLEPVKEKKETNDLTFLVKGEKYKINSADVLSKKTEPPKEYTEATLLSAMENAGRFVEDEKLKEKLKDSGIGTPATRAAIIERLIYVGYIKRKGKNLIPEDKGLKLIDIVPIELKSPETTGKWEKGLSSVSKGKLESDRFMESIKRFVVFLIDSSKTKKDVVFERENTKKSRKSNGLGKCPLCGQGNIYENTKAFYCQNWKNGCNYTVWKNCLDSYGQKLDEKMMKKLLKDRRIDNVKLVMPQTGERGTGTIILNKDRNFALEIMNFKRD